MDSGQLEFVPYGGDLMGLYVDDNHLVFKWNGPGKVIFSVSRRGNAASCHFASNKKGLRYIKKAVDEFVQFVFWLFDWCTMVLAQVKVESVKRMLPKCDFHPVAEAEGFTIFARIKE